MLPDLLRMQTLQYKVIDPDQQIVSLEAYLMAENRIIKSLS